MVDGTLVWKVTFVSTKQPHPLVPIWSGKVSDSDTKKRNIQWKESMEKFSSRGSATDRKSTNIYLVEGEIFRRVLNEAEGVYLGV